MSKYKNHPPLCVLMNFSFASFLQIFFTSYSTKLKLLEITFEEVSTLVCTLETCFEYFVNHILKISMEKILEY